MDSQPFGKVFGTCRESPLVRKCIRCHAYYQLHRQSGADTKAVYVSTGGNPTENQFCGLVSVTPQAKHHLCFDNDNAGRIFALNFAYQPKLEWRDYVYSLKDPLDVKSGDYSLLPKDARDLYAKAESLEIEYYSSKSSGLVCKEDLEDIKSETLMLSNSLMSHT